MAIENQPHTGFEFFQVDARLNRSAFRFTLPTDETGTIDHRDACLMLGVAVANVMPCPMEVLAGAVETVVSNGFLPSGERTLTEVDRAQIEFAKSAGRLLTLTAIARIKAEQAAG